MTENISNVNLTKNSFLYESLLCFATNEKGEVIVFDPVENLKQCMVKDVDTINKSLCDVQKLNDGRILVTG